MEWNAQKYYETCGRVTEHGTKLVDVLRERNCKKVLDLGCGTGVLTSEIAGFADEVIGIDSSPAMIEKAKESFPGLPFIVMDACSLLWDNYFDAVFSNAVFHFIKSQDILLNNVHKVLAPKGLLVCEFGASGNIARLLDSVAQSCNKRNKPFSLRFYYPAQETYKQLLEESGFCIESIITYDLDTQLKEGELGLRNWISQIFNAEMEWFDASEKEEVLKEIESSLGPFHWDGSNWHLANRRIKVIARKGRQAITP